MAAKAFDTKILPKKEAYDISSGFETVPVTAEEEAIMVNNFQYVPHMICGPGVNINFTESLYPGCDCTNECNERSCVCILRYSPNYDRQGRLLKAENKADTRHVRRLTAVCEPVRVRWVDGLLARSGREITSLVDLAKDLRFVKLVEAVTNLDINSFVNKYRWKERK